MKTIVSILTILLCMASPSYAQLLLKILPESWLSLWMKLPSRHGLSSKKATVKVILPTQNQLKMSSSGIDLLGKLQLPRITVDIMSGRNNHFRQRRSTITDQRCSGYLYRDILPQPRRYSPHRISRYSRSTLRKRCCRDRLYNQKQKSGR